MHDNIMKLNFQVLLRYILAFLIFAFLMLPLFIPTWYYIFNFNMKNEIAHVAGRLKSGMEVIDSSITALNNASVVTSANSQFRVLRYNSQNDNTEGLAVSPYLLTELRNYINTLLTTNPLIADSGVLISGLAIVSNRIFYYPGINVFYDTFLKCEDLSKEEWLNLLAEKKPIIPALRYRSIDHGSYEALTCSMRLSYGYPLEENILFATIPVDRIIPLILDREIAELGSVRIYDAAGVILYEREAKSLAQQNIIREESPVSNLRYEIGVPDFFITEKTRLVRLMILSYAVGILVVMLLLSFVFAWKTTKPVQVFLETLESARMINSRFVSGYTKKLSLNPFKGFMQIYNGIGESISYADKELESSFHTIEHETQLLRVRISDKIREALESGNPDIACTILHETAAALSSQEDIQLSKLISGLFIDMAEELTAKYPDVLKSTEIPEYVPDRQDSYFNRLLPDYFQQICTLMKNHREENITRQEQSILDFIGGHLFDSNLYITMVCDQFKISAPSIQKLVKKVSGRTFLVYVENLRMNRACEILKAGDHTIVETASLCGFSNANSFSRAFKRVYGFPPSVLNASTFNSNH
jgi:AraC-like DNA-binding protein